ncbi:MAG: iron chelate uptake ABC transporter family permease subunit [Actinomycetia bacterium]|nr:iron chelate uptake ABC transporter family permease subunit [Actinomycetes bacterium]
MIILIILVLMSMVMPLIGAATFVNIPTTIFFALSGALAAIFLVHSISNTRGKIAVITLLLSGVALSAMLSSVSSFKKIPDAGIYRR